MPANVETMMYTREKPWHDTGVMVQEAPTSHEALRLAGLDWTVDSRPVYDELIREIPGYKANVRSSDNKTLGIVTDRYKIVQNTDAFEFTDNLIGGDVHYETAGSLQGEVYTATLEKKTHIYKEEKCPHCGEVISTSEWDDWEEVEFASGFYGYDLEENGILHDFCNGLHFKEEVRPAKMA